jgi:uncharacterized protein (DUF2147 family)
MKRMSLSTALIMAITAKVAWAQDATPTGLWMNIDDESGKPKAAIRIVEEGGEYVGRIEKLFTAPGEDANPICTKCDGARKNKPLIGMAILYGMKRNGDEYVGGKILDPDNGEVYSSKLTVLEHGAKLGVLGYLGVPMLGRTQIWIRQQ